MRVLGLLGLLLTLLFSLQASATNKFGQVSTRDPSNAVYTEAWRGFIVTTGSITIGSTSETPLLYLVNSSSNTYVLKSLLRKFVDTTATHSAVFNLYTNPTCSVNGTALTPQNSKTDTNAPASTMTAYKSPTCSANGTAVTSVSTQNVDQVSTIPVYADPGNTLLVTVVVSNSSDKVIAESFWAED